MPIFETFFTKRSRWVTLETLYNAERVDAICLYLTEQHIPHRVRAAMLPAGCGSPFPARSLWYLSVREQDAARVRHYLRTEANF